MNLDIDRPIIDVFVAIGAVVITTIFKSATTMTTTRLTIHKVIDPIGCTMAMPLYRISSHIVICVGT